MDEHYQSMMDECGGRDVRDGLRLASRALSASSGGRRSAPKTAATTDIVLLASRVLGNWSPAPGRDGTGWIADRLSADYQAAAALRRAHQDEEASR
jgi:hypothetical protein